MSALVYLSSSGDACTANDIAIGSRYVRCHFGGGGSHEIGCTSDSSSSSSYFGETRGGTAMQVANRFFAWRNSQGVTSCLSSAAEPQTDWLTVTVRRVGGRGVRAPPLAKPARHLSISHALSRTQFTGNCEANTFLAHFLNFFWPHPLYGNRWHARMRDVLNLWSAYT